MTNFGVLDYIDESQSYRLGRIFVRFGWITFWVQLVLGVVPVVLVLFALVFRKLAPEGAGTIAELSLAYTCSLFVLFSILWSFRYTRLGRKMMHSEKRQKFSVVNRTLQIGLIGNLVGMASSTVVAMGGVGIMLLTMLTEPQGAIQLAEPNLGISPSGLGSQWIVPLDLIWIQASLNNIAAQLFGAGVSLFLLHRVGRFRLKNGDLLDLRSDNEQR